MDEDANTRLLSAPWQCVKANDDNVYYLKYHIGNTDYRLLVTDLRRVWYDAANARALKKQAISHRLVIDDDEQLHQLLKHLETFLQDVKGKCQVEQLKEGQELRIKGSELQGFATLTWTFMCKALSGQLLEEAPTVLYDHFILPMLMLAEKTTNQPDVRPDISFGKPDEACILNDSWLEAMHKASASTVQSKRAHSEQVADSPPPLAAATEASPMPAGTATAPDHAEPDSVDVAQESQLPSSSLSESSSKRKEGRAAVRQKPKQKKRRLFG